MLDRLKQAEITVAAVEAGQFSIQAPDGGKDEIARLTTALSRMAQSVQDNTEKLEETVRERTEQLRRIAYLDPLTGVLNRRGFAETFDERQADAPRAERGSV